MQNDSQAGGVRVRGMLWAVFVADALAMPGHWYYDRGALRRDYGELRDFVAPKARHPDSILWRSSYHPRHPRGEILHPEHRPFWGRRGVHYHQFLDAGDSTLNLRLTELLLEGLVEVGRYDPDAYLERYVQFMTAAGSHRDTYLEECHRNFFGRYAEGQAPRDCGGDDIHIGALAGMWPILAWYADDPDEAEAFAVEHVRHTHRGSLAEGSARVVARAALELLGGAPADAVIEDAARDPAGPSAGVDLELTRWEGWQPELAVAARFGTACYLDRALPGALQLVYNYRNDLEAGLIANANLGGDSCHRGVVVGGLLGAALGESAIPSRWREGLARRATLSPLIEACAARAVRR